MVTSLRIPDELGKRLATLAEVTGRTKSFYILECISAHIDDMEDIYLSLATLERIRRGEEQVYSLDEVKKKLNMKVTDEEKCLEMAN